MNTKQPLRQHLVARALRGAADAGVHDAAIEFHQPDGSRIVVRAGGGKPPAVRKPVAAAVVKPVKARPPALSRNPRPAR
jgi:hypothetical protein